MKPKEWLFQNGHIDSIGRGRLSAAHKALIAEAMEKNPSLKIEGFELSKPSTANPVPEVKRVAVSDSSTRILDCPEPLRDARDFKVVFADTGKPVPMVGPANVCNGCRNSFTYCPCPNPRVWVDADREAMIAFKSTS